MIIILSTTSPFPNSLTIFCKVFLFSSSSINCSALSIWFSLMLGMYFFQGYLNSRVYHFWLFFLKHVPSINNKLKLEDFLQCFPYSLFLLLNLISVLMNPGFFLSFLKVINQYHFCFHYFIIYYQKTP